MANGLRSSTSGSQTHTGYISSQPHATPKMKSSLIYRAESATMHGDWVWNSLTRLKVSIIETTSRGAGRPHPVGYLWYGQQASDRELPTDAPQPTRSVE